MNIEFYIVSADRRARRLLPKKAVYVFGRDPSVDIPLQDALVSRKHGQFQFQEDRWYLVDLGSSNGIFINDQRLEGSVVLNDGDRVQAGGQVYSFFMLPPGSDISTISQQAPEISSQVTMAPGMKFSDLATDSAAFSGTITENGLLELLQFFSMTKKTGRIDLIDQPGNSIWAVDGVPRDATDGTHMGFDALMTLASNPGKKFAFYSEALPPGGPSIEGNADGIMMEIARIMDEASR